MSKPPSPKNLVTLDASQPVWDRCFMVAPLVLVGTRDADGSLDLAPKHMAFPMGWQNYYGFVCSPTHHTYTNINRTGETPISTELANSPSAIRNRPRFCMRASLHHHANLVGRKRCCKVSPRFQPRKSMANLSKTHTCISNAGISKRLKDLVTIA